MTLELVVATLKQPEWTRCVKSWSDTTPPGHHWTAQLMENDLTGDELLNSYQSATEKSTADILGFLHDDLLISELGWHERVMKEFEDETVGLAGFGGALSHGAKDMYRIPYQLPQLGRGRFMSNMREAEAHGIRFTGECDVAVLDGFALFVRREILQSVGGWPLSGPVGYIAYDYWLSCIVRRLGYRIRLVGVACDHLGGKSTGLNPNLGNAKFEEAHAYIYEHFSDVLPYEVTR